MAENPWHSIKSFAANLARRIRTFLSPAANPPQVTPNAPFDPTRVANPLFSGTESEPGATYQKGAWIFKLYFRNPGTRSQGQHGVLIKDGVEVKGSQEGEILQTELGEFVYRKDPEHISFLWDVSGWDFNGEKPVRADDVERM